MAVLTSDQAQKNYPIAKPAMGGVICCSIGNLIIPTNPAPGDIWQMVRIPAGVTVVGGMIYSADLDTNAAELLDIDFGWEANGDDVADPDGLGNLGVMGTDTVAGIKAEGGYQFPLGGVLITSGPKAFTKETVLSFTVVAAAATFASGRVSVAVYYRNVDF